MRIFKFRNGSVEGIGHKKWWWRGIWRHPRTTQEKRHRISDRERNEIRTEYGINLHGCRSRYLRDTYDDINRPFGRGTKKKKGDWHKTRRSGKADRQNEIKKE